AGYKPVHTAIPRVSARKQATFAGQKPSSGTAARLALAHPACTECGYGRTPKPVVGTHRCGTRLAAHPSATLAEASAAQAGRAPSQGTGGTLCPAAYVWAK